MRDEKKGARELSENRIRITDYFVAAAVVVTSREEPTLQRELDGRVSFLFHPTDGVLNAIDGYNSGGAIPAEKYARTLRDLRGRMVRMRDGVGR